MEKRLKFYTLFMVVLLSVSLFSSCKDKDDEPDSPEGLSKELVGTWYNVYDGVIDYTDKFYFGSDGNGYYDYQGDKDTFAYTYNSNDKILYLKFRVWESEVIYLTWNGKNEVEFDGYGTYIRK